jgi:hypothetical protein
MIIDRDLVNIPLMAASSFMTKPVTFGALVELMRKVGEILSKVCKANYQTS